MAFLLVCPLSHAQNINTFKPTDQFVIPENNGSISFSMNGTYEQANLENGAWKFVNLSFTNMPQQAPLNLSVAAQDSALTITSYRAVGNTNVSMGNVRLRYEVVGQGVQVFNFGSIPQKGIWSVVFDTVFRGQRDGWNVSPEGIVTVTGAASSSNVTIIYYTYPEWFASIYDLPFYQQHSLLIVTGGALAAVIVIGMVLWRKRQNLPTQKSVAI
jgi:hypothetical protein